MTYRPEAIDRISTLAGELMHDPNPKVREFAARVLDLIPEAKLQFTSEPKSSLADLAIPGAHGVYNGAGTLSHYLRNRLSG